MNTLLRVNKVVTNVVTKVTDDYFWKTKIESLYEVAPIPLEITRHHNVDWKEVYQRMLGLKRDGDSHLSYKVFTTDDIDDVRVALWMGVDPSINYNYAIGRASRIGHIEVVRLLLADKRVDPSASDNYAVRCTSKNGHTEVVKLLLTDKRISSTYKVL